MMSNFIIERKKSKLDFYNLSIEEFIRKYED